MFSRDRCRTSSSRVRPGAARTCKRPAPRRRTRRAGDRQWHRHKASATGRGRLLDRCTIDPRRNPQRTPRQRHRPRHQRHLRHQHHLHRRHSHPRCRRSCCRSRRYHPSRSFHRCHWCQRSCRHHHHCRPRWCPQYLQLPPSHPSCWCPRSTSRIPRRRPGAERRHSPWQDPSLRAIGDWKSGASCFTTRQDSCRIGSAQFSRLRLEIGRLAAPPPGTP